MEADTSLIRADGVVVLNTVTHVGLHVAFIVYPSYTELVYSVWNAKTFNQIGLVEFRMFVVFFFNGRKNFFYCLMILRFVGEPSLQIF